MRNPFAFPRPPSQDPNHTPPGGSIQPRTWAAVPGVMAVVVISVAMAMQSPNAAPAGDPVGSASLSASAAAASQGDTPFVALGPEMSPGDGPGAGPSATAGPSGGTPGPSGAAADPTPGEPGSPSSTPSRTPSPDPATPTPTPRSTPRVTPAPTPPPVSGSFALGLWSGQPWEPSRLDEAISLIGRRPAIFMTYQDWAHRPAQYLASDARAIASRGASWMVTWEPSDGTGGCQSSYSLASIASGAHDAFITSWAKAAASWGGTIYLRFMHEMNGDWYPWAVDGGHCGNTASAFVAAWRHTHDLFAAAGAHNVKWVWSPNVRYGSLYPFANLYPGSGYVDWVALDGYNWGGQVSGHPGWQSLRSIFSATYQQVVGYGKPIMIAETASAQAGGDKAAWIRTGYLSDVPTYLPRVRAVIYFNQNAETAFRIDSSSQSLQAFREVAASKAWQGRIP